MPIKPSAISGKFQNNGTKRNSSRSAQILHVLKILYPILRGGERDRERERQRQRETETERETEREERES